MTHDQDWRSPWPHGRGQSFRIALHLEIGNAIFGGASEQSCHRIEQMFVFYGILDLATWAVPSESLQGVRRVPMAKFTALLLAASVLVLSIALLVLAVF